MGGKPRGVWTDVPCAECGKIVRTSEKHYQKMKLLTRRTCSQQCSGKQRKKARPLLSRFYARVEKTPGCWPFHGAGNGSGYVRFFDGKKKSAAYAHRVSYELHFGEIPAGLHIDHLCSNRACVRPDHLEAVTLLENNRRQRARARERKDAAALRACGREGGKE